MADLFETKNGVVYIAFDQQEKEFIYTLGKHIMDQLNENPPNNKTWCKHDWDSLTIPLLCKPIEQGGESLDLQLKQINKYNKALIKAFNLTFFELFEIELTDNFLDSDDMRQRMINLRNQKVNNRYYSKDK